jgi:SAM-dependent methyltransferase
MAATIVGREPEPALPSPIKLNLGCGPFAAAGWINCDVQPRPGVTVCRDVRAGLPFGDGDIDCIAAIHFLQDLPYTDLGPVLRELRRVMKPGGVLRLALPDLDKSIQAYSRNDPGYFYVPDGDALSIGAKLITQVVWYGSVRTPFNFEFAAEWLRRAGYRDIQRCAFGVTHSAFAELASLDNRPRESLFVEATN